ncbi:MAG: hypothetical protein P8X90_27490 [Desulfobacterales bacterium]
MGGAEVDAMLELMEKDILTKVSRYNLIRNERLIYIDVHESLAGNLAAKFVAVPNLINIVARQVFQGTGNTEAEALQNCLSKIKGHDIDELFPTAGPKKPETT